MLNNGDIIAKLSEEQKIALVTDIGAASSDLMLSLGVPHVRYCDIGELNDGYCADASYPSLFAMSRSWNKQLIGQAIEDILQRPGTEAFNIVSTPPASVSTSAYAVGLSEDPYFNSEMCVQSVSSIESTGCVACLDGGSVRPIDVDYMDAQPDNTALADLLTYGFNTAMKKSNPSIVKLSYDKLRGEWSDINARIVEANLKKRNVKTIVVADAPEEALRVGLTTRALKFEGLPVGAVRGALRNYRRMKEDVERGTVSVDELKKAVEQGTAISDETLDIAVDDIISFALSVNKPRKHYAAQEGVTGASDYSKRQALLAAQECIVMLKNDGSSLPIVGSARIGVVGELAHDIADFDETAQRMCAANGATYVGFESGYTIEADRNDELLPKVADLAARSDTVLVFVGLGARREKELAENKTVRLPANQIAALDAAVKSGKNVVAVAVGDVLPDTAFDSYARSVLFAPVGGSRTAEAVFGVVFGVVSPSGRLTVSGYEDTDKTFLRQKSEVASGKYAIGEFVGYRRYITENSRVKYPFGYGLTFARFEYSKFKVTGNTVEFTLRNAGTRAARETPQLYIGKRDSAIVRPLRVLKGFTKILLAPGTSTKVQFAVDPDMLTVFDAESGIYKIERGNYEVYIGSSAADIKYTCSMTFDGVSLNPSSASLADFLPIMSNIESGDYKLHSMLGDSDRPGAFKSAKPSRDFSYERLFTEQFGADEQADEVAETSDEDTDVIYYYDDGMTVKAVANDFSRFAASRGLGISPSEACTVVAAMAASRVVMTACGKDDFALLVGTLGEYFGCNVNIDGAALYESSEDLFVSGTDTGLLSALSFADSHRETVTISALDDVEPSMLGEVFAPFIRYATAPEKGKVNFGREVKRAAAVSQNLWFFMRIADGWSKKFPAYLADMASVITPTVTRLNTNGATIVPTPDYYKFVAACAYAERKYEVDEKLWKKLDRLEKYVSSKTKFAIDNKMSIQMEKSLAVYLACGAEQDAAFDCAIASKIVPLVSSALAEALTRDDPDIVQTLETIFGEDNVSRCKLAVKRLGA